MPGPIRDTLTLLERSIDEAHHHDRDDLARRLTGEREQLTGGAWHVLVAGEFKSGKSTFVNALLGLDVCGADPVDATQVPTFVRYGVTPRATLLLATGTDKSEAGVEVPVREAAAAALRGAGGDGAPLRAVEVQLPRALLRDGLVLLDSPGLGGGYRSAQAAATMRAMAMADAVVVVSDAAQEYTAADVELLTRAAGQVPHLLTVLTKTDLHPQWQRILQRNEQHLRDAGLGVRLLAVSGLLRLHAVDAGSAQLNDESGFPAVARWLRETMLLGREQRSAGRVASAVHSSLRQLASTASAAAPAPDPGAAPEAAAAAPADAPAVPAAVAAGRWQHLVNDRFADISAQVEHDLQQRVLRLDEEASARIRGGDPSADWPETVDWLYARTNDELTAAHTGMLEQVAAVDAEVAALFESAGAAGVRDGAGPPAAGTAFRLNAPDRHDAGRLELSMQAARGWSLSSSVVTTVLVATLHPGLLVVLPITVALGSVFAWKAVRGYKAQRLEQARQAALRSVTAYLQQARGEAARAASSYLRHSRTGMRDFYADRADELARTAQLQRLAAQRATTGDPGQARLRAAESQRELERVRELLRAAEQLLGPVR